MAPLRIREAQLRVLREAAHLHAIESGLLRHFPELCEPMNRADLGRFVRQSRARARLFGIQPPDHQGFASLELVFGECYWESREFRWARRILEDKDIESHAERFHTLRDSSIRYLASKAADEELASEALAL